MASPDTANYSLLQAVIRFKISGSGTFRHLGNAPKISLQLVREKLDHFSSMTGTRAKDKTFTKTKSGTLNVQLEEFTKENLALWAMDAGYSGSGAIDIFADPSIAGEILVTGTNDEGNQFEWHLLNVEFGPGTAVELISENVAILELQGDILAVNGAFGTITPIVPT